MPPSRPLPRIGMRAYAGDAPDPLTVTGVNGPRVEVQGAEGPSRAFVLHRLTGHWVQEGGPYWGLRLRLAPDEDVPAG